VGEIVDDQTAHQATNALKKGKKNEKSPVLEL
jgi:hypothetical protein